MFISCKSCNPVNFLDIMSEKIVNVQSGFEKPENLLRDSGKDSISLKRLNIPAIFLLTRLHVYMPICFFCTAVGLDLADSPRKLSALLTIGMAITFALAATYAFNDVEDVSDDRLTPAPRNVIALGKVSKRIGYLVAILACGTSVLLSVIAGTTVCFIILAIVVIGFLYSWKSVRIKTKPFWDVLSNAVVGGLMFLASSWSSGVLFEYHLLLVCLIFFLGTGAALIVHQLFDYQGDLAVNIKTTVVVLGKRKSCWILGSLYFIMGCLLVNECRSGFFSLTLILSFCIVAICLILIRIILFRKQIAHMSDCKVSWAINVGAGAAILVWYVNG